MTEKVKEFITSAWKEEIFIINLIFVYGYYVYSQDEAFFSTAFFPSVAALVGSFGINKITSK